MRQLGVMVVELVISGSLDFEWVVLWIIDCSMGANSAPEIVRRLGVMGVDWVEVGSMDFEMATTGSMEDSGGNRVRLMGVY